MGEVSEVKANAWDVSEPRMGRWVVEIGMPACWRAEMGRSLGLGDQATHLAVDSGRVASSSACSQRGQRVEKVPGGRMRVTSST